MPATGPHNFAAQRIHTDMQGMDQLAVVLNLCQPGAIHHRLRAPEFQEQASDFHLSLFAPVSIPGAGIRRVLGRSSELRGCNRPLEEQHR
jgi:hypothetical protein